MSYSCLQATVQPEILSAFIKEEELEVLKRHFSCEEHSAHDGSVRYYFYSEEYSVDEEEEDEMIGIFRNVIKRSNGTLNYVYIHGASYCTKMYADAFGGSLIFIKPKSVRRISTWDTIDKFKK
jgi:hypothetical protein